MTRTYGRTVHTCAPDGGSLCSMASMRRLPVLVGLIALALVSCSGPGSPGSGPVPPASTLPPPTTTGSFDAVHATGVLKPAVGMVVVSAQRGANTGSGFVIASQGGTSFMVTNNHVVESGGRVQVLMPDGHHFPAQVQGTDPQEDVAVLRIDSALPQAQFADSSKAQVGEPVLAIGSPLGNQSTVTVGVISALHRSLTGVSGAQGTASENLPDVLQTDAPINQGSSGGPLADGNGRVVGMNTAGNETANGIGYAIPSLVVKRIAENLIAGRKPGHPYLGVCYMSMEQALIAGQQVEGYGVLVTGTAPGGPAETAGIQSGDVIEKVDGVDLNNGQTLGGVLQLHNPGDVVPLVLARTGSTRDVKASLADRPATPAGC
jgi:S1-C subfamily serine protease